MGTTIQSFWHKHRDSTSSLSLPRSQPQSASNSLREQLQKDAALPPYSLNVFEAITDSGILAKHRVREATLRGDTHYVANGMLKTRLAFGLERPLRVPNQSSATGS